ncbi:MFS transporter [Roseateles sp. DC23W]|uniref:MFS transporter n=1 Tax=Pelomonas dachongensis TaxID=3299029 RepID=A0ABW7EN83_9BURK
MTTTPDEGAFAPLRERVFAVLWVATVLGNVGSFMRDVASGWLVTELSPHPAAVAAVQAAASLPVFLFAIPAGVLADILDRRRFLIAVQCLLAAVSAALMLLSHSGALDLASLLALTFVGGIGAALMGPTWQAIVPALVPRTQLRSAVALNSLGVNIARSLGPAAGGVLLATWGAAVTYGADLLTYALVIAALLWWRPTPAATDPLAEPFGGALRAGLRHAMANRDLHRVLLRAGLFFAFASAAWALLPLVGRQLLQGDAAFYGVMLGAVGSGAIGGALALPQLRQRLGADALLMVAAWLCAAVMALLALSPPRALALAALLLLGVAWIVALTILGSLTQTVLPNWVRGRGLAVYLTVFNGALATGSLAWGAIAQGLGLVGTLLLAAATLAVLGVVARRWPLPAGDEVLDPALAWPVPELAGAVPGERGPVLVHVEYRVAAGDRPAFEALLVQLSAHRRGDGASDWGVTEDAADPQQLVEWFVLPSWQEHLRQHHRTSQAAVALQARLHQFHQGPGKPVVRHLLTLRPVPLHQN